MDNTQVVSPPQQFLITNLDHICRYKTYPFPAGADPWPLMQSKLLELEEPIRRLKLGQMQAAQERFSYYLSRNQLTETVVGEFRGALAWSISPGDYEDVALLLDIKKLANPNCRRSIVAMLAELKPFSLFDEEKKPARVRFRTPETRIQEMAAAVGIPALERIMAHHPPTIFRRRFVLRRLRRRIANYRYGLRPPLANNVPLNPIMTNQIEALVVAVLRFTDKFPS